MDNFIHVTNEVIFLDKCAGDDTASEIMRERNVHLAITRHQRIRKKAWHHVKAVTPI